MYKFNSIFKPKSPPPFNSLGLLTAMRTYAQRIDKSDPDSVVESWEEIVTRVVLAANSQLKCGYTEEEQKEFFDLVYGLKCSVAGRFLWQLGTPTVDKLGLMSLQNCAFTVVDEPITPFVWVMNFLMLGCGTGYRILPSDVEKIPNPHRVTIKREDTRDADFIVPDSREGWVKLLARLLKAHFYSGKSFTYSCILLRSAGAPIKGFGGLASGPEVLCDGLVSINKILNERAGMKMRSIDALDVMNIIGQIVVSGNVRRSAQIAIGDCEDKEFIMAKRWDLGPIPNYRNGSNNSVQCNDFEKIKNTDLFWEGYNGNGEPYGLINMELSKTCGRLGETQYPDPNVEGYNPCFPGDTWVMTADGAKMIDDCVGKQQTMIVNGEPYKTTDSGFFKTGERKIYTLTTEDGYKVQATGNHLFYTGNDTWRPLNRLEAGDDVCVHTHGSIKPWGNPELANSEKHEGFKTMSDVTDDIERRSYAFYTGYLRKVFQFVNISDYALYLNTQSRSHTEGLQRMLARVGILSYIGGRLQNCKEVEETEMPLEIIISYHSSIKNFIKHIGLMDDDKIVRLNALMEKMQSIEPDDNITVIVESVVDTGYVSAVYDCTVPEVSRFDANGFVVHNCAEQSLANKETCCLAEIFLPNVSTKEELFKCAMYLYRTCKNSLALPCRDSKETEEIVHRNMRIGIGVTGYLQATEEQKQWLDPCYKYLRQYDVMYSAKHNFPTSVKLTTCKPSGTLSLLGGVTSGVHPGFSQYYIRRVRISSKSPLIQVAKEHGYDVEYQRNFDNTNDVRTMIISFPQELPANTIFAENCTAVQQLEYVRRLQTDWSDNSVSCTVYYKKGELPSIKEWLSENYNNSIKSVSFLLHSEHGFQQAPLEAITKEKYDDMMSRCRPIVNISGVSNGSSKDDEEYIGESECPGGYCPIK